MHTKIYHSGLKFHAIVRFSLLLIISIYLSSSLYSQGYYPKDKNSSVVVLELFSSQGCNSCPPADKLLDQITQKANSLNQNILGLNFHVDYWDYLGWKDPYATHLYSERQYQYSDHFKLSSVYTPQLIINGQQQLVGSNQEPIEDFIKKYLEIKPSIIIDNLTTSVKDGLINITGTLSETKENLFINLAVIENESYTRITAGENQGLNLKNTNIVRVFVQETLHSSTVFSSQLKIPDDLLSNNMTLIVYIQDPVNFKIYGGTKIHLK